MRAEKRARGVLAAEYNSAGIEHQAAALMAQGHQPGGVHRAAVKVIAAAITPQWEPISTAPKDGSKVLIWRVGWDFAPLARWDFVEDDESGELFGGWVFDEFLTIGVSNGFLGWKEDIEDGHMPTHYLPAPPESP